MSDDTWIGLSDIKKDGQWSWESGAALSEEVASHWEKGKGNGGYKDCGYIYANKILDGTCKNKRRFVCQKPGMLSLKIEETLLSLNFWGDTCPEFAGHDQKTCSLQLSSIYRNRLREGEGEQVADPSVRPVTGSPLPRDIQGPGQGIHASGKASHFSN